MKTNELINAFKTWDGRAFILNHLQYLKSIAEGNRLMKQHAIMPPEDAVTPKPKRIKYVPVRNKEKAERRFVISTLGIRQAKKYWREQKAAV